MGEYLGQLRSWQLLAVVAVVFVADLLVPDPVPILDEVLLGVLTLFLARWEETWAGIASVGPSG